MKMHLSLKVADLQRSVEFYSAFFGVPPHKVRPGYANFDLSEPPLKFALTQHPDVCAHPDAGVKGGALDHLGFQMGSKAEVEAVKARLQAAGLATFDETDTVCCYARQDKVWAHDPDGNEWEVYVLTDDLEDEHAHDHAGNSLAEGTSLSNMPLVEPAHRCCAG